AYESKGSYGQAIIDETWAISLNPEYGFIAFHARGTALAYEGRLEQAINDLSKAITLQPYAGFPYIDRALAYEQMGARDRALKDYARELVLLNGTIAKEPASAFLYVAR